MLNAWKFCLLRLPGATLWELCGSRSARSSAGNPEDGQGGDEAKKKKQYTFSLAEHVCLTGDGRVVVRTSLCFL